MRRQLILFILVVTMINVSCSKPEGYGNLDVSISYTANGRPLLTDTLAYTNEAGNRFLITEIQWFISKVTLQDDSGNSYSLGHIFYIDTNIPESQTLEVASLPCGHYTSLRFTFGLDQEDNVTGLFVNPPESNMFWPDPLGGGYHYMKLNGKYLNENNELAPMNIHLGIGQNEDHTIFYQNFFTVELPLDFYVKENKDNHLYLNMNIDNWFRSPNTYDIAAFGSAIMQNQEAQQLLKENGHDVFEVGIESNLTDDVAHALKDLFHKAAPKPHFYTKKNMEELFSDFLSPKTKKP